VAVEQAEVAATNAMGEGRCHAASLPAAILKGVGIDLASAGRLDPHPGEDVIIIDDPGGCPT
jgi:NAD(P)H-nitrite reductase large subunit